jgi:uncharacterized integral membrane protein
MRQINFFMGFVLICSLILFGLENPDPVAVQVVPGTLEFDLPLCLLIFVSMGLGVLMGWVLVVWADIQNRFSQGKDKRKLAEQDKLIRSLQDDLGRYKNSLEKREELDRLQEELDSYKAVLEEQRLLPGIE